MKSGSWYLTILRCSIIVLVAASLFSCSKGGGSSSDAASGSVSLGSTVNDPAELDNFLNNEAVYSSYIIKITPANATVSKGSTVQFTATATSGSSVINATNYVTWRSSNTQVVTIDARGKATAVGAGTATITASYQTLGSMTQLTVAASGGSAGGTAPKCIVNLAQWKIRYTTSSLSCTQCHTTTVPGHGGTEGTPWRISNCRECHEGPHGSVSDD